MNLIPLLSLVQLSYSNICSSDTYFIDNYHDFNQLNNCSILDANLFINGEYNINNLTALKNITQINGFLVIIDSHTISNLEGLNNLVRIEGNELYLDQYSVAIKHNLGTHSGLCYADNVLWQNITNHPVNINNNAVGCPDCHDECLGCFGPGPKLCQFCKNFKYFDTCVSNCPSNFTNYICEEVAPSEPILYGNILDNNTINIYWNKSNIYDFIDSINIYLDNLLINNLSPYRDQYNIDDLQYSTTYKIEVQFVNSVGSSSKSNSIYIQSIQSTTHTSTATTTITSTATTTMTSTATTTMTSTAITTMTSTATSTITSTPTSTRTSTPTTTKTSTYTTTMTSTATTTHTTTTYTTTDTTTFTSTIPSSTSTFSTAATLTSSYTNSDISVINVSVHDTNTEDDDITWWLFLLIPLGIILIIIIIILGVMYKLKKQDKKIHPEHVHKRQGLNNPIYGNTTPGKVKSNPVYGSTPVVNRVPNPVYVGADRVPDPVYVGADRVPNTVYVGTNRLHNNNIYESNLSDSSEESV